MKKTLLALCMAALIGCASTEEFVEGSKILGSLLWHSAPRTENVCVTGSFGVECISYTVPNDQLTPEQKAEIERQVTEEYLEEKRRKETPRI
ncbi:hypothetical protein ACL7TT_11670 [Microbulbifer sp. 2304DJ12-6]|uniref:hypothetical protein n=1 Tax=Microbulbifer sp. 2304DJ12-6 TaxID=3233340 RepID=UPI0039AEAC18